MFKTHFEKLYWAKIALFPIFITTLLLLPQSVQASSTWSDDFSDGSIDGWETWAYSSSNIWTGKLSSSDVKFSVIDGALTSPDINSSAIVAHAYHDSQIAYGSWKFDWIVSTDKQSVDAIEFISSDTTNNYNWTGLSESQKSINGYGITLGSYSESGVNVPAPGVGLAKVSYTSGQLLAVSLGSHKFDSELEGKHQIEITRNIDGNFKVFFDSELLIEVTDNVHKTSEKFGFTSWIGASSIDNIEVSDVISDENDSPLFLWFLFPTLLILAINRKRITK